ncbi:MAG: hypothetical protein HOO96_03420 [Polyangiaceae bacterium]|nr:hypothetical protein [Polyangiaceae bacterium]
MKFYGSHVLLCVALLGAAPVASAQTPGPSSADMESARALIKQARALRDAGDLPGAAEKFKAAHALGRTPVTGIELAKAYAAIKKYVEARDVALQVTVIPVTADETSRSTDARTEATKLAADLKPKLAALRVEIELTPKGRSGAVPSVTIDGQAVPAEALSEARTVNPGKHDVVARVGDGPEARGTATLDEGASGSVKLLVTVPEAKVAGGSIVTPPPTPPPAPGHMSPLVPIGLALAAGGAAVGTIAGISALSQKSSLDDSCTNGKSGCAPGYQDKLDGARTAGTVATIGFIAGGAGLALAVVGLFVGGKAEAKTSTARVIPYLGPASVGFHGTF